LQVPRGPRRGFESGQARGIDTFLEKAQAGVLYVNRLSGATNGAWPGIQSFCGWKGSGITGKGALGPNYLPQFMREQSRCASGVDSFAWPQQSGAQRPASPPKRQGQGAG
jgi:1-pyrroline-5-carboxylate dehydrogenase